METTLFYIFLTLFLVFLCEISKKKKSDKGIYMAYTVLAFVSVIRYDVGWDYIGYSLVIQQICDTGFSDVASIIIATSGKISEPFILLLCYLFMDMEYPYLWVFGCYSILTIFFVFLAVNNHSFRNLDPDRNKWSIIAIVIYYFLFFTWDGVRQGLAISIVLFSYRFVQQKSLAKFLITIIMACFIHLSAFLALPLYLMRNLKYDKRRSLIALGVVMLLYIIGAFRSLSSIAEFVPYYSRYAEKSEYMDNFYGFSALMLLKYIMWFMTVSLIPKKQNFLGNGFTVGVIIYIMASGAQVFERIGDYYYFSIILLLPEIVEHCRKKMGLLYLTLIIVAFVCYYDMAITQKRGVTPYQTIWSDNFKQGRVKEHVEY